nr:MAG TPA: hypothetical protein [Caudoviricetes sp.]
MARTNALSLIIFRFVLQTHQLFQLVNQIFHKPRVFPFNPFRNGNQFRCYYFPRHTFHRDLNCSAVSPIVFNKINRNSAQIFHFNSPLSPQMCPAVRAHFINLKPIVPFFFVVGWPHFRGVKSLIGFPAAWAFRNPRADTDPPALVHHFSHFDFTPALCLHHLCQHFRESRVFFRQPQNQCHDPAHNGRIRRIVKSNAHAGAEIFPVFKKLYAKSTQILHFIASRIFFKISFSSVSLLVLCRSRNGFSPL